MGVNHPDCPESSVVGRTSTSTSRKLTGEGLVLGHGTPGRREGRDPTRTKGDGVGSIPSIRLHTRTSLNSTLLEGTPCSLRTGPEVVHPWFSRPGVSVRFTVHGVGTRVPLDFTKVIDGTGNILVPPLFSKIVLLVYEK